MGLRGATAAVIVTAMLITLLVPLSEAEAAEPVVIATYDFEAIGIFISAWEPLGWSRGNYAEDHQDDQWCRANGDVYRSLSSVLEALVIAQKADPNDERGKKKIAMIYGRPVDMRDGEWHETPDGKRYWTSNESPDIVLSPAKYRRYLATASEVEE